MTSFLGRPQTSVRLGELLVQAGMLTQIQLQEAVRHSKGKRLQIGQVLIMFGYLSPRDLQSALEAQSALRDKSVDYNLALRCLKIAYKIGGSFKDILQDHEGGTSQKKAPTSKLGELLVEAGVINNDQLTRAIEESLATGLPLGRMLVLHQSVSPEALKTALDVQTRVRDEMLTRDEALTAIREAGGLEPLAPGEESRVHNGTAVPSLRKKGIRLGELLVLAGVITESDVMTALEAGLLKQQPLGQALVSQNIVSQDILDGALTLQSEVDEGRLEPLAAAECLTKCHTTGVSPQEAMKDRGSARTPSKAVINYEKLLTLARVVSPEDIGAAFDISSKSSQIIGKVLVLTGYMEVSTLQATLRCYQLLSKGLITQDDAVATLDYCLHQPEGAQLTFDQALHELGWIGKKELTMTGEKPSETFAPEEESAAERLQKLLDSIPPPPTKSTEFDLPTSRPEPKAAEIPASKNTTLSNIPVQPVEPANEATPSDTSNSLPAQSISLTASSEADTVSDIIFDGLIQDTFDKKSDKAPRQEMSRKFAQTILPEDAKAKQLAMMVSREVQGNQNLNPEEESDAVYDAFSRLAESYSEQGNYAESQHVYERILVHRLNQFGPNHPILVQEFANLAGVLCAQEKFNQAEPFMRRAVAVLETAQAEEVKLAECLNLLGMIYFRQEKLTEAEKTLVRTIELRRAHLGANHPDVGLALNDYARVLKKLGQNEEAEKAYSTAKTILGGT